MSMLLSYKGWLKSLVLKIPGLESSYLKSQGLKGLGLKLGVEKSRVEISFNLFQLSNPVGVFLPISEFFRISRQLREFLKVQVHQFLL